jgi:hypothetical protein
LPEQPEKPSLDDAFDKLRWAGHHFKILRQHVEALKQRDAHTISVEVNTNAGEYALNINGLEQPDPNWGLVVGDCVHNARTALDYLMVRLVALVRRCDPKDVPDVGFPIITADRVPEGISGDAVEVAQRETHLKARDRFLSVTGKLRKEPGFTGYLARIEELQPYNSENPSIWGIEDPIGAYETNVGWVRAVPGNLARLSELDNIDKHRVVHAAWSQLSFLGTAGRELTVPDGFRLLSSSPAAAYPLENGAQIDLLRFETPLPFEWKPGEVDMKRAYPLDVCIGEPPELLDALVVLRLGLWSVDAVLRLFVPVFARLDPPLPVTTVPPSDPFKFLDG